MNKRRLLLILLCACILTACNTEVADADGASPQIESTTVVEETKTESPASGYVALSETSTEESKSEASASEENLEVRRTIVKSYETQDGQKSTDVFTDITEQTFDGQGNMVLEELYGGKEGERLKKRSVYSYDERGNVLRSEEYLDDALGTRNRIWEYEYDDKNQKIKGVLIATEEGQNDTTYLYSYDEAGKLVEQKRIREREFCEIRKYTYNEAGDILCESSNIPSKGDVWKDTTYQYVYDDAGKIVKLERFDEGELYCTIEYTYDTAGNMLTKKETSVDLIAAGLWSYEYDEQGNCIKEDCFFAENDPYWNQIREYDEQGRLQKSVIVYYDGIGIVEEYSYE